MVISGPNPFPGFSDEVSVPRHLPGQWPAGRLAGGPKNLIDFTSPIGDNCSVDSTNHGGGIAMKPFYACGSPEHAMSRRKFLTGTAAGLGMLGFSDMIRASDEIARQQKRVLVIFLAGGSSQLETWDPKPGTNTGGPFQAIPTNVPGVHISELLPFTARQMHRLALVRGINTNSDDHGLGQYIMETGRRSTPGEKFPHLGSAMAKLLGAEGSPLPGYIHISPGAGAASTNRNDAAFLGPRYACVNLPDGTQPANLNRPPTLTELADSQREDLRARANARFMRTRRSADTEAYTNSYAQAAQVMAQANIFDLNRVPAGLRDRMAIMSSAGIACSPAGCSRPASPS